MTAVLEAHYARSADRTNLPYQVSGEGPLDLVFDHDSRVPTDVLSEDPGFIRIRRRIDTFARTAWFDAGGLGALCPPTSTPGP